MCGSMSRHDKAIIYLEGTNSQKRNSLQILNRQKSELGQRVPELRTVEKWRRAAVQCWVLNTEYWISNTDCWVQSTEHGVLSVEYWISSVEYEVLDIEWWVFSTECWALNWALIKMSYWDRWIASIAKPLILVFFWALQLSEQEVPEVLS